MIWQSRMAGVTRRTLGKLGGIAMLSALLTIPGSVTAEDPAGAGDTQALHVSADAVAAGRVAYSRYCASCHGANLNNGSAPALQGNAFAMRWLGGSRTLGDLDRAVRRMPKYAGGSLSDEVYRNLTAYILSANGYETGGAAGMKETLKSLLADEDEAAAEPPRDDKAPDLPARPATVAPAQTSAPSDAELLDPAPSDWLMFNRTYAGDRYSPLSQINASNVSSLRPVCILSPGVLGSFQSSPIVYKGMGFVSSTYGVYAFDPTSCARKWDYTYAPSGPEGIRTSRGLAAYDGKLFRGTPDGHLIALDMITGKLLWDVHVADGAERYSIGAAPVVYKGRVIVGLAGGDYGNVGHIYAFDADTGELVWTFDTIHAQSWSKGAEYGGGGTWTTAAIDPEKGLVFLPVGNPAPDYYLGARPGDNLYTNSIVALDAGTGKLAWYVQQLAQDFHDWDTSAAPILYEKDSRRLMAVGTKEGIVFIYDRKTQELVSRTSVVTRVNETVPLSDKPLKVCPGTTAGVEWNGPAFDPATGSLIVNSVDWCAYYTATPPQGKKPGEWYVEAEVENDAPENSKGWTYALDGATGKERWKREAPRPMIGAVTPTAGGIVLTGGADGMFLALDARDGRELYSFNTGGAIGGGVATYLVDGRQYVAVATGGIGLVDFGIDGAPALIVFALPEGSE